MKILMVAIPNHHFFQWVNQLKTSGYEVYWFDVTDGAGFSKKIEWVTQCNGWRLRFNFPYRQRIKRYFPKLYYLIQNYNEVKVERAFAKIYKQIQPDIVHCFEMQLSGLPILPILKNNSVLLVYSSWGSDMFNFEALDVTKAQAKTFLQRVDYLITDCKRDYKIAKQLGFKNKFLGVFPGNGGIDIPIENILSAKERDTILIKGYDDGVGQAIKVLQAIEVIDYTQLKDTQLLVYSADKAVENYIKQSQKLSFLKIKVFSRYQFIDNKIILKHMGKAVLHIANSTSDGLPNALLEAMGMGAFPIQSNPGNVTEEVVSHNKNGFLIENPLDEIEISYLIKEALLNEQLRIKAQHFNVEFIENRCNRIMLQKKIIEIYKKVLTSNV